LRGRRAAADRQQELRQRAGAVALGQPLDEQRALAVLQRRQAARPDPAEVRPLTSPDHGSSQDGGEQAKSAR